MTTSTLRRLQRDDPAFAAAVSDAAGRCTSEDQRGELAAYLYLVSELPLGRIAEVFEVDVPRARRLVERGSGVAPVTSGDGCRGWALVAPRSARTAPERVAAHGHLSLCRGCRNRLRAHEAVERRVAEVGTATFGVGVVAAVVRTVAGGPVAMASGSVPIAVLSGALAITAGAGALVATQHRSHPAPGHVVPAASVVSSTPSPSVGGSSAGGTDTTAPTATTPATGVPTDPPATNPPGLLPLPTSVPLPGRGSTPLPLPSLPQLPTGGVTAPALPLPLPTASLRVPLPKVTLSPPLVP